METYTNGTPHRVIVRQRDGMWCAEIVNEYGAVLRLPDFDEVERSFVAPSNKRKTIAAGKRLARDLGIPGYEMHSKCGFLPL